MFGALHLSAAVLLIAGVTGAADAPDIELDRVVAVVRSAAAPEPRIVVLSRVHDETRIERVARGEPGAATERLTGQELAMGLESVVEQLLLLDEATRLRVFEIEASDTAAEVDRFKARLGGDAGYHAFLSRWGLREDDVAAVLSRRVRVERYVDSRVSHAAQVSEAEVTAWLDEHAAELGTRDREVARTQLAAQRLAAEARTLVQAVRARADVRILSDLARGAASPALGAG